MTVKIISVKDDTELFCHYASQSEPQRCFIALDLEDGTLWADYNAEIGSAVPEAVWNGRTIRFPAPCMTAAGMNHLMDEIAPLADRVLAGSEIEWDGNNHVGKLDEDAQDASDEIERICDELEPAPSETVTEWDACEFYDAVKDELGVTADSTDAELEALAEKLEEEDSIYEWTGGPMVLNGTLEFLQSIRDNLREEAADEDDEEDS